MKKNLKKKNHVVNKNLIIKIVNIKTFLFKEFN